MRPIPPRWADQTRLLIALALADLRAGTGVRPTLVAFAGDRPLLLATLRPFDKGAHDDAVLEVGALAMALGADRLALSLSGRAWSQQDPIPPVLDDGCDLRQRVIVVHVADAAGGADVHQVRSACTIVPYDLDGAGGVVTGDRIEGPEGEGFVPQALRVIAAAGGSGGGAAAEAAGEAADEAADEAIARQVARCERLGHRLAWAGEVRPRVDRLRGLAPSPPTSGPTGPAARPGS
jgi:hypothetical protein